MQIDETIISNILTTAGPAGVLLWILARVVMRVAERMIAAIDKVGDRMDRHTADERAHVGKLAEDIGAIKARLGIESGPVRRPTNPALAVVPPEDAR